MRHEPLPMRLKLRSHSPIHIVTTGNRPGDHAHKLWTDAQRGEGPWRAIFLPWSAHPQQTQAWYAANVEAAIQPRLARREYAACPEDAFAAPEGIFFERFSREHNVKEFSVVENWPIVRTLASVGPDRHRPDVHDERSPYTHVLDALRCWTVNRAEPMEPYSEWGPQTPPSGGYRLPGINGRPLPNPSYGYMPSPYDYRRLPRPY
jgi:hypothetical protein